MLAHVRARTATRSAGPATRRPGWRRVTWRKP